ncbi:C2H2 type zinc-finger-domain-containing protein [Radiomyces spectabilis]|uniref:C2H2 type zinc-finger-domain-containing protein n=1 Tax=Radiomyces spectabilis TaxID=64574 RepID=UPI00222030C6|nr:C2H2 type zinc-finger-domain-containing protein [Radiomyces spectabilis]KAI8394226.1 C2H2 type zinc-finger-domain-containing protein [Radiomyces spectabilis]
MSDQEAAVPSSGLYTCISCQVAFQSADSQRLHYRSDWHRYNLKRKVANLPPISNEQFQLKVNAKQEAETRVTETQQFKGYCDVCRKSFATENTYNNHVQSKKHKEMEAKNANRVKAPAAKEKEKIERESPIDLTITDETTEEEMLAKIDEKIKSAKRLEETDCLFCTHKAETFEDNMTHMTTTHSFFIPDIEFLVDLRGLVRYLGEKISVGNLCLYCNGKGRGLRSLEAVRAHMIDKGHCKIAYEEDDDAAELVDFYDFSSSYPQLDGEEVDADADLSALTQSLQLADDEMSLVLPSGAIVGHRALKRYYDQSLKPEETRDSVLINKLIGQYSESNVYQSLRSSGNRRLLITDGRKANVRHTEAFKDARVHDEYRTRVGIQSNKLQKYFRIQII